MGARQNRQPCPLRQAALRRPEQIACCSDEHGQISFRQLDLWVEHYGRQLLAQGLQPGQRLVWSGANSLALIVAILACMRSGQIIVPLNHKLPVSRQAALIAAVDADALVCADADLAEAAQSLIAAGQKRDRLRRLPPPDLAPKPAHAANPHALSALPLDGDRAMDLLFTSGSSGQPKAVAHSLNNHLASARGSRRLIPLQPGDRWLLSLPLAHIGGMAILFRCLQANATLVLAETTTMADAIGDQQISHLSLVSTQLYRLLASPSDAPLSQLRYLLLGGSAVDQSLLDLARQRGLNCFTSYGMTEMSSQICTGPALGNNIVGQPLPGAEIRLTAEGEVTVRGSMLALGYLRDHQLLALSDHGGWFATGDLAEMTPQGVRLLGRKDNRFICGGENIVPELIEQRLLQHPVISRAVVVAVPDPEWGQRPAALTNPIDARQQAELADLLKAELGALWVPAYWRVLAEQDPSLKPDRRRLTAEFDIARNAPTSPT